MTASPHRSGVLPGLLIVTLGMVLLPACGDESSPAPPQPPAQTVNELVETTGWFPDIVPDSTAFSQARFDSSGSGGNLECADFQGYQRREVTGLTTLAADLDRHYPGAVLQYASLGEATPAAVTAARAAATLELTGADGTVVSGMVDALDGDLVAAWRENSVGDLPAVDGTWRLSLAEIYDPALLPLAAGVDPQAWPAGLTDQLVPDDTPRARVLARLERIHHTASCAYPGRAAGAFADDVLGADLADQMAEGNPPVWVGDVHHGQLVLLLCEAETAFDQLVDACLNSLQAAIAGTAIDAGRPVLAEQPGLVVRGHGIAADAADAAMAAAAGVDELTTWLATPVTAPASLPAITAELYALRNGGPITLAVESTFWFTSCEIYEPIFADVLWSLDAADARTERRAGDLQSNGEGRFYYVGGSRDYIYDHVTAVPDLRGAGGVARPDEFGRDPIIFHDIAGGRPAIELYELGLPDGDIYTQLLFDGAPFAGVSYTLFFVIGLPDILRMTVETDTDPVIISQANRVNYFLHGENLADDRRNLVLGYPTGREFVYAHPPYQMVVSHDMPEGWFVYAARFDQNGGMTVWENDQQIGHSDWDYSLLGFDGARICTRWRGQTPISHASLLLAEAIAYRGAGTDDEVLAEIARLRQKYGF